MNITLSTENIWLDTEEHSSSHCCENGSDVVSPLHKTMKNIRVTSLCVLVILGVLGNSLMLGWLWTHRKRRVRIVQLFGHLAIADVLVTLSGTLPLLILEYMGPGWPAGEAFCKIFNFLLGFGSCASNYMMVPIAFDRFRAVKRPLALRLKVDINLINHSLHQINRNLVREYILCNNHSSELIHLLNVMQFLRYPLEL
ncbi:gonadotropin-releasing hormone receptor-like [Limulus polyphemus]|uniref:Gonadotropin-releasing hormone receptor-like n=1 Tax=Limulus polyphemus TaxID=6850 RepID=A0ABM1C0C5_LIMPO|nr:gonadotropin-releasing hormone receptor-like [Limulus polyphemus]